MNDSRLRELAEEIHVEGQGRCAICFWPLAESAEKGCVRGNCSMRGESGEYERHSHRAKVEAIIKTLKASTVLAAALAEPASDLRAKLESLRDEFGGMVNDARSSVVVHKAIVAPYSFVMALEGIHKRLTAILDGKG